MNNFSFFNNTKIIFGEGQINQLTQETEESPDDLQINHQIRVEAHLVA